MAVAADRHVVERGIRLRGQRQAVEKRREKARLLDAFRGGVLLGEQHRGGPERRGSARAADRVPVAVVPDEPAARRARTGGDIGQHAVAVADVRRGLPRRRRVVRVRPAAAAAVGQRVLPTGLVAVGSVRLQRQKRASDRDDLRSVARKVDGEGVVRERVALAVVGAAVPARAEDRDPTPVGEPQDVLEAVSEVCGKAGVAEAPAERDDLRLAVGKHAVEDVDEARRGFGRLVVDDLGSRSDRRADVEVEIVLGLVLGSAAAVDLHVDRRGPIDAELAAERLHVVARLRDVRRERLERHERDRPALAGDPPLQERRHVVGERAVLRLERAVRQVGGGRYRLRAQADDARDKRPERGRDPWSGRRRVVAAAARIEVVEEAHAEEPSQDPGARSGRDLRPLGIDRGDVDAVLSQKAR